MFLTKTLAMPPVPVLKPPNVEPKLLRAFMVKEYYIEARFNKGGFSSPEEQRYFEDLMQTIDTDAKAGYISLEIADETQFNDYMAEPLLKALGYTVKRADTLYICWV